MRASVVLLVLLTGPVAAQDYYERFADLALACVHQEYPNNILHHMTGPDQVGQPHQLYPAFYGCFDWHSSVHGHWLLVRMLSSGALPERRQKIVEKLSQSFTRENLSGELAYFSAEGRAGFERPYGRAWFFQLTSELRQWDDPLARQWLETLVPLERLLRDQTMSWLPKLTYPIRSGTHSQTAFAFGLMLDAARVAEDNEFEAMLLSKVREFYLEDEECPLGYEPSGEDFFSPCLMEADLIRRVLPADEFAKWLDDFLPVIPANGASDWLAVGVVLDPSDGKLVHLDGLNLSRAWALEGIASALPKGDPRVTALKTAAELHRKAGLASVTGDHYAGGHWLASFATYLLSGNVLAK